MRAGTIPTNLIYCVSFCAKYSIHITTDIKQCALTILTTFLNNFQPQWQLSFEPHFNIIRTAFKRPCDFLQYIVLANKI